MTTEHVHWKKLVNPDYIGAYCIEQDMTFKILAVIQEEVKGDKGASSMCTVAHLENSKPFIINRTNAKTITKIYGSPYIDTWVGKLITVYPTTTKVAGETVECLRIRPTKPEPVKVDYSAQEKLLRACKTLDELQACYTSMTADHKTGTVAVKDEMKTKLTKPIQSEIG